jgi:TonB family protein
MAFCLFAGQIWAASKELHYGPPGDWVVPAPSPTDAPAPPGAPYRYVYSDIQVRLGPEGDETYTGQRVKILSPDGLSIGNVSLTWNPSTDDLIIHGLKIRRDSRVIDVLDTTRFNIIQREDNLDYAMLDGKLTATLQVPGVQVGDEVEFMVTTRRRDLVFGDRSFGALALPVMATPGAHRVRFIWPEGKPLNWQVTQDLPAPERGMVNGQHFKTYELRDPASSMLVDGAPRRFNVRRLIEYSAFSSWSDISAVLKPLYDKASTLAPDSQVRREAARIAASTGNPMARAEAALALVQERVRYVYVGLEDGNYRPEAADDTWSRRFGDCKAKTALLVALLRELGIAAQPALVDAQGGDGTDQRLPSPGSFNHMVVKAVIDGKTYWLDGTRLGDRRLALLPPPPFRWALPLDDARTTLEKVDQEAPMLPEFIDVLDVDATSGFDVPAKVSAERIFRGEGIFRLRTTLSGMAEADARQAQESMWRDDLTWVEPDTVAWRYDEQRGVMIMTMRGEGKLEWLGNDASGRALDLFNVGFTPPKPLRRPRQQDQSAPWATDFPAFSCWATTVRLPSSKDPRWRWDHDAAPVNRKVGGIAYWRQVRIEGDVLHSVVGKRTYLPELTPAQAQELNDRIPSFNKYVSRVFQVDHRLLAVAAPLQPAWTSIDWSGSSVPCAAPDGLQPEVSSAGELDGASAPAKTLPPAVPEAKVESKPRQDPANPVTQPMYPSISVMNREEGAVILKFVVRQDGTVDAPSIAVSESSGFPALDEAAITEAASWRFIPAMKAGKPVAAAHQFRVVFELKRPALAGFGGLPDMPAIMRDSTPSAAVPSPDPGRPITQPPYPADALAAGQEGDVILQFTVAADGFVDPGSIEVKKSSGFPSLDKAAVDEASVNWRFRPATLNGHPVAAPHRFRVVFDLKQAGEKDQ